VSGEGEWETGRKGDGERGRMGDGEIRSFREKVRGERRFQASGIRL